MDTPRSGPYCAGEEARAAAGRVVGQAAAAGAGAEARGRGQAAWGLFWPGAAWERCGGLAVGLTRWYREKQSKRCGGERGGLARQRLERVERSKQSE